MRILLCTDTFLPEVNGVTTVLATMRDGLRRRGHSVFVVAPEYGTPTTDESDVRRLAAVPCPGYQQVWLSWPWGRGLSREFDRFAPLAGDDVQCGAMREAARAFAVGRDWARELDELESAFERLNRTRIAAPAPSSWPTTTSVG